MLIKKLYETYKALVGQEITLKGWVRTNRDSGKVGFISLNDGSYLDSIQVVYNQEIRTFNEIKSLRTGSSIAVTGVLVLPDKGKELFEIKATNIKIYNNAVEQYPLQKKEHSNDNNKLEVTLNSILKQKDKDYEIIIVDDKAKDDTLEYITKFFQEHSDTIKVISSWKEIETANAWNLVLSNAKGTYVLFLQPGYKLINNFMENIIQEINNNDEPDLIEFMVQYSNVYHHISSRRLKNNNLYHPLLNREVFALIHHSLFNKLFKRKIITSHKITFRRSNRFDLLFIYKILPWIETLYTSTKILVDIEIEPFLNFNSFDFLKQWVHIYNYYKQINLARELIEELEYAFVRFHYYTFLKVIAPTGNKVLVKKAIQEVTNKVTKRFPHWEKNQYLNLVPDDLFNKDVAKDWKKYLKNFV